jgi:hypothetical protein
MTKKEKKKIYSHNYYLAHREETVKRVKKWRLANLDKTRESARKARRKYYWVHKNDQRARPEHKTRYLCKTERDEILKFNSMLDAALAKIQ